MEMILMTLKRRKWLIIIVVLFLSCMYAISFASKSTLIFVGNSYENGRNIDTTIMINDEVIFNGFMEEGRMPMLIDRRKMKVGFYKVKAKLDSRQVETTFFYFFQNSIWIDFDHTNISPLLISKCYKQIPL